MIVDYYLLAATGVMCAFVALLLLEFISKERITIWHAFAVGGIAGFSTAIVNNYTALIDWLVLGLTGVSTAAMIFIAGMVSMIFVMTWNFIASKGKTVVR